MEDITQRNWITSRPSEVSTTKLLHILNQTDLTDNWQATERSHIPWVSDSRVVHHTVSKTSIYISRNLYMRWETGAGLESRPHGFWRTSSPDKQLVITHFHSSPETKVMDGERYQWATKQTIKSAKCQKTKPKNTAWKQHFSQTTQWKHLEITLYSSTTF